MTRRGTVAGFTLLELVVVLAIFALIATMSIQALQGTIRGQQRLEAQARDSAALARAVLRLRHDLQAAVPLAFAEPGGAVRPALLPDPAGAGFDLSLGGQPQLDGAAAPGLHRVSWRFDPARGVLSRRLWLSLVPAQTAAAGPEIAYLDGIAGIEIAGFDRQGRWVARWQPGPDDGPDTLPLALRIRIETRDRGRIEIVERF